MIALLSVYLPLFTLRFFCDDVVTATLAGVAVFSLLDFLASGASSLSSLSVAALSFVADVFFSLGALLLNGCFFSLVILGSVALHLSVDFILSALRLVFIVVSATMRRFARFTRPEADDSGDFKEE